MSDATTCPTCKKPKVRCAAADSIVCVSLNCPNCHGHTPPVAEPPAEATGLRSPNDVTYVCTPAEWIALHSQLAALQPLAEIGRLAVERRAAWKRIWNAQDLTIDEGSRLHTDAVEALNESCDAHIAAASALGKGKPGEEGT